MMTAALEDLIKLCAAEVTLTVRQHRSYNQSIEGYINEIGLLDAAGGLLPAELRQRIIECGVVYELRFYPNTPAAFYDVCGTSLDEVVIEAMAIMRRDYPERFT